ncbi:hypothetical protein MSG28_000009 [Choristoneura fumiferana]|uniref:Uncharacterized protein n=1 Tax=Choristoneura fumiferana TaxID=7141 RepID=A0ACC0JYW3_CHOFU|nr:hypothetical protein MSG28_000009 [Choristoneura fumiferana]
MMQSTTEGCMNIAELANQLTREKIFISSERQLLQNLNEELEKSALELLQAAWICSQQRQNLTDLMNARCEAESIAACQRASQLEGTTFIDVYKVLKYKEALALGELLGWLRDSPHLVSLCLLLGEESLPPTLPPACARLPADRTRLLAVIRSLMKHQLATASDPRKEESFRSRRGLHPYVVSIPKIRTKRFRSSFINRTAKEWGSLPATVFPEHYHLAAFKCKVNEHLLGKRAPSRDCGQTQDYYILLKKKSLPLTAPHSLLAVWYGSARFGIGSLVKHQQATATKPRKLFRSGKSALACLYSVFRDGHAPARQFLVAALQAPVMFALHEDELFLDCDPDKAMERYPTPQAQIEGKPQESSRVRNAIFSPQDRLKKFGQTNSAEYAAKLARYRKWTVQSLYNLTSRFINSLRENWANFPASIAWLIQQSVHLIKQHSG